MKAALGAPSCRKRWRTYADASEKELWRQHRERRRHRSNPQVHPGPTTRYARTPLTGNERGGACQGLSLAGGPQSASRVEARTVGYLGSPQNRSARRLKKSGLPAMSITAVQLSLTLLPPVRTSSNVSPKYARVRAKPPCRRERHDR